MSTVRNQVKTQLSFVKSMIKGFESNADNLQLLGRKVHGLKENLKEADDCLFFVDNGGVNLLCNVMQVPHHTLQMTTINCFLNVLCHFSVLRKLTFEADHDLFVALVKMTHFGQSAFNHERINGTLCILTIFIDLSSNGRELLHEAVVSNSKSLGKEPYLHLVSHLRDGQLRKKTIKFLACLLRIPIPSKTGQLLRMLENGDIVNTLKSMEQILKEDEKVLVSEVLMAFGNSQQKEQWRQKRLPFLTLERRIASLVKARVAQENPVALDEEEIFKMVDKELTERIEEEFITYDGKWRRMESRWDIADAQGKHSAMQFRSLTSDMSEESILDSIETMMQRNRLRKYPSMCSFYQSLQLNLNRVMVALLSIQSKLVQQSDKKSTITNICQTAITLAGESVPLPGIEAAANVITLSMKRYRSKKRKQKNSQMSIIAINVGDMEEISEACARLLTFRYAEQLNTLTVKGAKLWGAVGARLILEDLRCGSMNVLDSALSQTTIVHNLVNGFAVNVPSRPKGFLRPKCKKISCKDGEEWDPVLAFTQPGIRVGSSYYEEGLDPYTYGYRLGSAEEVKNLKESTRINSLVAMMFFEDEVTDENNGFLRTMKTFKKLPPVLVEDDEEKRDIPWARGEVKRLKADVFRHADDINLLKYKIEQLQSCISRKKAVRAKSTKEEPAKTV